MMAKGTATVVRLTVVVNVEVPDAVSRRLFLGKEVFRGGRCF